MLSLLKVSLMPPSLYLWNKLAEHCANYIGKGRLVAVDGRLQIRSYDGNDGQRKYITEVVAETVKFLDRAKEEPLAEFEGVEGDPF